MQNPRNGNPGNNSCCMFGVEELALFTQEKNPGFILFIHNNAETKVHIEAKVRRLFL